jgi:cation diffusion facilitator CzcD-associated flavoprotein CzcO
MATSSLDGSAAASAAASASASEGPSVAIIGCGPAGMFFLRQLEKERERLLQLKEKLETTAETTTTTEAGGDADAVDDADADSIEKRLLTLPRPTVFEKDSRCGGLWQSKSMTPNDGGDDGEGMYDGMWINSPKEIFEFEDYTFDEHFRKPMPSYITRQQVLGYINGVTKDALETYTNNGSIIFDTKVSWIDFDKTTNLFSVESVPSTGTPMGTYVVCLSNVDTLCVSNVL